MVLQSQAPEPAIGRRAHANSVFRTLPRDGGQKRLGAGQPFPIALAAFLDLSGRLVRRGHGASIASNRVPVEANR